MRVFKVYLTNELFEKLKRFLLEEHEVECSTDTKVIQELFYVEGGLCRNPFDERESVKVEEVSK